MDSSQNWLGFSLSNSHHQIHPDSSSPSGATDLSILSGAAAPKLEDFLGCGGGNPVSAAATAVSGGSRFSVETVSETVNEEIYDSELKRIAASFLRGFSADQPQIDASSCNQKQLTVATAAVTSLSDPAIKKTTDTFGQRTSIYRGVTRHRWTGRYEAHLWDNSCRREGQSRKGRQVYLGGYDKEDKAARAYDLAALKYWGPSTTTNFPITNYEKELGEMKNMTRQEFVASLRRRSSGFSRGASIYRGVTRHHQHGRWQARIGRVAGNKDLYLGTFSTQEEAAEAYDIAAIKFRGLNAVTNFDMSRYDVKSIAKSNLPVGGGISGGKPKHDTIADGNQPEDRDFSSSVPSALTFSAAAVPIVKPDTSTDYWAIFGPSSPYPNNPPLNAGHIPKPFFSLDFSASCCNNSGGDSAQNESGSGGGLLGVGGGGNSDYVQHQRSGSSVSTSSVPYPMPPVGLNIGGGCEGGSWVTTTPFHAFQASKPTVSVFQTPIFGME